MIDKRFWNCYNGKHKLNYRGNIILNLLLSISNIYCTHHVAETHYTVSFHRIKWVVFNWFQPWSPTPCTNTDVSILYNRVTDHYFHTIYVFIFFEYYCYFDILLFMRSIRKRKEEKNASVIWFSAELLALLSYSAFSCLKTTAGIVMNTFNENKKS